MYSTLIAALTAINLQLYLLQKIIEGRMNGKAFRGRNRLHMLSDLALSAKYLKANGQQKIKKDGELQTDEESHNSATQQIITRRISDLVKRTNMLT